MSGSQINTLQLEAAARASREGHVPLVVWGRDELTYAPFLGEYIPPGWRAAVWADTEPLARPKGSDWWHGEQAALFVDSSGFASDYEPALSLREAEDWVECLMHSARGQTFGVGILEAGEFQVYLGLYVKDETSPGIPVESEDFGLCPNCGEEDGEFDYHECSQAPTETEAMTTRCSIHRTETDPADPEVLWSLLVAPGHKALVLCDAGHYVEVTGPALPLDVLLGWADAQTASAERFRT